MFGGSKTKSQRIIFCKDFLVFFQQKNNQYLLYLTKKYRTEETAFGIEFFNISEKDEEHIGSLLLEFCQQKKLIKNS
jgi:hypothetical protein